MAEQLEGGVMLGKDPLLAEARAVLAEATRQDQLLKERLNSVEAMTASVAAGSGFAEPFSNLQTVFEELQTLKQKKESLLLRVEDLCEKVLSANPDEIEALRIKASMLGLAGKTIDALSVTLQLASLAPSDSVLQMALVAKLVREAITALDRIRKSDPRHLAALEFMVMLCSTIGEGELAADVRRQIGYLKGVGRLDPQSSKERAIIAEAAVARSSTNRNPKQVVFVSDFLQTREQRFAKFLISQGYEVIALYNQPGIYPVEGAFSRAIRYDNEWSALEIASKFRPLVYHIFSKSVDETSLLLIRNKPGPVVFDSYDIFPGLVPGISREPHDTWQAEAFASADGICSRDLKYLCALRVNSWKRNNKTLWFPEYLEAVSPSILRPEDDPIRAVTVGWIFDPAQATFNNAEATFRPLVEMGIHLEIYPHPFAKHLSRQQHEAQMANLLALGGGKDMVHVHDLVPPDELIGQLANFDVGLMFVPETLADGKSIFHPEIYAVAGSSRVHDYIAANLVVLGDPRCQLSKFMATRYGKWMDMDSVFAPGGLQKLKEAVNDAKTSPRSRAALMMDTNILRLVNFYEAVAKDI